MKILHLTVNSKEYTVIANEHDMLSTVIREKIGLTGTKIGCSQGSCGACTVLVNNEAVLSCITPAFRFDHAEITTIEGLSQNGELHALQEKFVEKGAIQCGFCTPGMIMTSLDYIHKHPSTTKEQIKESLSGNVCRCTGYKKIVEAVTAYVQDLQKEIQSNNLNKEAPSTHGVGTGRPSIEAGRKA